MESKLSPKGDNIVGKRYKRSEKSSNNIKVIGADNDDTTVIEVLAVGKDCVETKVGEILLLPLSSIRSIVDGTEYIICSERAVFASINQ